MYKLQILTDEVEIMTTFCISLLNRLIHDIKKINYIKESRVKTSTVCISWLFPNCPFCFQQSQTFQRSNFDDAKTRELLFLTKRSCFAFFYYFTYLSSQIVYLRKTKCTTRCSAKNPTRYERKVYFIFSCFVFKINQIV